MPAARRRGSGFADAGRDVMPALILVVAGPSRARENRLDSLKQSGWDVIDATGARGAVKLVGEVRPSLVVIDGDLADGSALELVRRLRADLHYEDLPVLVLAGPQLARECIASPKLGVDCLLQPAGPREVVAAIRHRLKRHLEHTDQGPVVLGSLSLDPQGRSVSSGDRVATLGAVESRLLHFLMTHPERVNSRTLLVEQVWGDRILVAERTVDVLVRRLRGQLDVIGCAHLVQTVRGAGYRFSVEPDADAD